MSMKHKRYLVARGTKTRQVLIEDGLIRLSSGEVLGGISLTIIKEPYNSDKKLERMGTALTDEEALWLADSLIQTVRHRMIEAVERSKSSISSAATSPSK